MKHPTPPGSPTAATFSPPLKPYHNPPPMNTKKATKQKTRSHQATHAEVEQYLVSEAETFGVPRSQLTGRILMKAENREQGLSAMFAAGLGGTGMLSQGSEDEKQPSIFAISREDIAKVIGARSTVSDSGVFMRPERYLYPINRISMPARVESGALGLRPHGLAAPIVQEYLRGFRDAADLIYQNLSGSVATPQRTQVAAETEGLFNLDVTGASVSAFTGAGVRIAILDTGIDSQHPDFVSGGRIVASRSFIPDEEIDDLNGHGTHCTGTASGPATPQTAMVPRYGAAGQAEILIGKVLSNQGGSAEQSVLEGLQWAIREGAQIISMSLGAAVWNHSPVDEIFESVAAEAMEKGVLIIAAAGNDSRRHLGLTRPVSHPANCPSVMAIGSLDSQLMVSSFSNGGGGHHGTGVDLAAPGEYIYSSLPVQLGRYGELSGTSMATPLVAGIAALWAESDPKLRGRSLWDQLMASAQATGGISDDVGAGLVKAPV